MANKDNGNGVCTAQIEYDVDIKDTKEKEKVQMVSFRELHKFAGKLEVFLMVVGCMCAAVSGLGFPLGSVVFGESIGAIVESGRLDNLLGQIPEFLQHVNLTVRDVHKNPNKLRVRCTELDQFYNVTNRCLDLELKESLTEALNEYVLYFVYIGTATMVFGTLHIICWNLSGERQVRKIRYFFFQSILRQEIGWFDCNDSGMLTTQMSNDIAKIQRGLGESCSLIVHFASCFVAGYIIGFVKLPKLAAVLVAFSPVMAIAGGLYGYLTASMTAKEQNAYAQAGSIAEEVLSSIRTVAAFGGETKEAIRYEANLGEAEKYGQKKGLANGVTVGLLNLANFSTYALGLWYGGKLIRDDDENIADMLMTYFTVSLGTFALGVTVPGFQNISEARGAAYNIYNLIGRQSRIDSASTEGKTPADLEGRIRFQDVHFSYPSRPDTKVLHGLTLDITPGQTVALVGASGCGKSTNVQLLLRFYDPDQGKVFIDGNDIRDLNISWLRQHIGLVSQEPVLFDRTIAENIRYGRDGVTMDEITMASKNANAYEFITKLPNGFETMVGEKGAQLSGGQKQRIAIARALVRDPKILLLDEATSALDTESEAIVQDALDKARQGRTTLVIAHRLSTVQTADVIVGIEDGKVKEKGTHDELMSSEGIYHTLVTNQTKSRDFDESLPISRSEIQIIQDEKRMSFDNDIEFKYGKGRRDSEYKKDNVSDVGLGRLLKLNKTEWHYLVLGCIGAVLFGCAQPAFAFVYSELLSVFQKEKSEQEDDVQKWSLVMVAIGVGAFFTSIMQNFMLSMAGEKLSKRIRAMTFKSMLRQEISWFDKPENGTGALTTRLAIDASKIQDASGSRLGMMFQAMVAILGAIALAFVFGWQLTLALMGLMPLLLLGGILQYKMIGGQMGSNKDAIESSGKIAVEAIENVRTVASLTKENTFLEDYMLVMRVLTTTHPLRRILIGFSFGLSQGVILYCITIIFAFGGYLIEEGDMSTDDMYKVFSFIMFCGIYLGQSAAFMPDFGSAINSANVVFGLIDSQPKIDSSSTTGKTIDKNSFQSVIVYKGAHFHYPTRPTVKVLQGLDLRIEPGKTVALVGSSGCGKSTTVGLLTRFYDLNDGSLNIDQHNIRDLNVSWLRRQIGLVSQEPVLFDRSIAENIAYGDNTRKVNMEEIMSAARDANIHTFIDALPNGYDTNVGSKGTQLSGGQKQRIAIARALVRNPKILLLDEATSALDTESEKIVQEALDRARAGRTCITIAHRLSTIQDADSIAVFSHGRVVEQGSHAELMAKQGLYYRLQNVQKNTSSGIGDAN